MYLERHLAYRLSYGFIDLFEIIGDDIGGVFFLG